MLQLALAIENIGRLALFVVGISCVAGFLNRKDT